MLTVVRSRKKGNPACPHMDLFWEATVGTQEQLWRKSSSKSNPKSSSGSSTQKTVAKIQIIAGLLWGSQTKISCSFSWKKYMQCCPNYNDLYLIAFRKTFFFKRYLAFITLIPASRWDAFNVLRLPPFNTIPMKCWPSSSTCLRTEPFPQDLIAPFINFLLDRRIKILWIFEEF